MANTAQGIAEYETLPRVLYSPYLTRMWCFNQLFSMGVHRLIISSRSCVSSDLLLFVLAYLLLNRVRNYHPGPTKNWFVRISLRIFCQSYHMPYLLASFRVPLSALNRIVQPKRYYRMAGKFDGEFNLTV